MDTEVKRQLWQPKANGRSCLPALWVLKVYNSVGEFVTYRCENAQDGKTHYMPEKALAEYYQPTEQYQVVD